MQKTSKKQPSADDIARGRRIAQARRDAGLSQQALATKIGVDKSAILRWESGELTPRDHLGGLCLALNKTREWILFGVTAAGAEPVYAAFGAFKTWLEAAPERTLAKPWMLENLRRLRFPESDPTQETYKMALFVMISADRTKEG